MGSCNAFTSLSRNLPASPLQGPFAVPADRLAPENLTERQVLFQYWARWRKWNRYQPLDHIRRYFGEKIALYFAWLGEYNALRSPPNNLPSSLAPTRPVNMQPWISCPILFSLEPAPLSPTNS